jgi:hypothetical protein
MEKTIILLTLVLASLNFLNVQAQPEKVSPNETYISPAGFSQDDSLLFDGNYKNSNYFNKVREECNLKVTKVSGKAYGTIITTVIEELCGEIDTVQKLTYGQLKVGDIVASEAFLRTQDFSQLEVETKDGKSVWLAPTTEFKMGRDYCMGKGVAELYSGRVHVHGGNGETDTYITTEHSMVHITKTEFSVEIVKEGDITTDVLKVYEGTVSFGLNMQNKEVGKKNDDKAAEMQKIADDFQNGKIGAEEFTRKMTELQTEMTKSLPQSTVTVNAGFQSKIVGTVNATEPESFNVNDNRWWEN